MNRRLDPALERFLAAEQAGREEDAEGALTALFGQLPALGPRPGFAARVLARVAMRPLFARPWVRWSLAASTLATALAAGLLLPLVGPVFGWIGPARLLHLLVAAFTSLLARVVRGLEVWETVAAVSRTLSEVALHLPILMLLVLQLAIAAAALHALAGLALPKRSDLHVAS